MKTLIASLTCTLVLHVTAARAGEPVPTPYVPHVAAAPLPSPPQSHPDAAGRSEHQLSKVEHLREAADHLEAAGAGELAAEVRAEADSLQEKSVELLDQKWEQLARLQQEIAELEELTGRYEQVMLRFRVVEMDVARMKQPGCFTNLIRGDQNFDGLFPTGFGVNDAGMITSFVDALAVQGLAKVLAEHVIVTTDGRPATAGKFPIPNPEQAGADEIRLAGPDNSVLTLEAVPIVLGAGKLRLDFARELATRSPVNLNASFATPANVRRTNTQVEMHFGETATLVMEAPLLSTSPSESQTIRQTSYETRQNDDSKVVTVICVTPEPVHAIHAQPAPDPQSIPVPDPQPHSEN
jgi:hypothetical protein